VLILLALPVHTMVIPGNFTCQTACLYMAWPAHLQRQPIQSARRSRRGFFLRLVKLSAVELCSLLEDGVQVPSSRCSDM
jgi:hypothetical protein